MKILVTGAAGFIGTHTVRALRARGDEVVGIDALTQPVHPADAEPPDGVVRADVRDPDAWREALHGVDAVVHLAAYQDYGQDFSRFMQVNAAGTALLYEVIVADGLPVRRVVYASSQSVYGEGQVRCTEHGIVAAAQREEAALARGDYEPRCRSCGLPGEAVAMREDFANPQNAYGIAKLAGEHAALALGRQHGIESVALRYAIVHGPGQSPRNAYSGLLRSACLAVLGGRAPMVFEDGRQLRDYVSIDDVVAANLVALDHPDAPGRAFNVGGARTWTVLQVLAALAEIVDEPREPDIAGVYRVGDVRHTIGDTGALRALGWTPSDDLPQTWRSYWTWLRDQQVAGDIAAEAIERMRESGILRTSGT